MHIAPLESHPLAHLVQGRYTSSSLAAFKWKYAEKGNNATFGMCQGHPDDPTFHTNDVPYAGTLSNGEPIPFTSQSTSPLTTTPVAIGSTINSPCQCLCGNNGESIVPPSCQNDEKATIDCKCRTKAIKKGVCENGYRFNKNLCFDTNECAKGNGGCSHACVNIPGDYYCACPHGWMLDPVNPKSCIKIAGSFERIA